MNASATTSTSTSTTGTSTTGTSTGTIGTSTAGTIGTSTAGTGATTSTAADPSPRRRALAVRRVVVSIAAPAVVVAVVVAAVVAGAIGGAPTAAATAVAIVAGVAAAVVDISTRRIPDRLVLVAALAVVTSIAVAVLHGHWSIVPAVVLGAAGFAGPLVAVHLAVPAAIGFGDVKLAAALGAALGLHDPRLGLLALCAATATTAVVGLVTRRATLPFGPGLVVGAIAAAAAGPVVFP